MLPDLRTVFIALWAPALAGTPAATITWLVWFYTTAPCTADNAIELMCRQNPMARYISTSVFHHCVIHASIAATIVGGPDLMLFLRERQRNNQMMEFIQTTLEQMAEERRQATEERRQAEERAAEERRQAAAQAAAQQEAFLEALNRLTEAVIQNSRGGQ